MLLNINAQIPLYEHDCEECKYLGKYENKIDLYTCEQNGIRRTYIARYSNTGSDYASSPLRIDVGLPELIEAKKRSE